MLASKTEPDNRLWDAADDATSGVMTSTLPMDALSASSLARMAEQEASRSNRVPGVRTALVVLSSKGMVFDVESLRQKVLHSYPEAAIFFLTTLGKAIGTSAPNHVDLLIDFTGPGQRQGMFLARKLRRMSRLTVGRNAGLFRRKIYDKIFDEKAKAIAQALPAETLERERRVQREVLALAGVAFVPAGDSAPDRGKLTPMELPPFSKL